MISRRKVLKAAGATALVGIAAAHGMDAALAQGKKGPGGPNQHGV